MSLADHVLALHEGIAEAFILEERAGHLFVVEEASRKKVATLANIIGESTESTALGPALILGAANQFSGTPGSVRLVGILYGDAGIVLAHLSQSRLLAISTDTSSFPNTMQLLNEALPGLMRNLETGNLIHGAVRSAGEAGQIARAYVAEAGRSSRISIEEVTYRAATHRWEVHGRYRPYFVTPWRGFEVELDGDAGTIMSFRSSSASSIMFALEIIAFLAAVSLTGWIVYASLLKR